MAAAEPLPPRHMRRIRYLARLRGVWGGELEISRTALGSLIPSRCGRGVNHAAVVRGGGGGCEGWELLREVLWGPNQSVGIP